ncbi:MAG: tetratricopeptide repeat protein [Burkholderiales bacterium]
MIFLIDGILLGSTFLGGVVGNLAASFLWEGSKWVCKPVLDKIPDIAKLFAQGGSQSNHDLLRALRRAECRVVVSLCDQTLLDDFGLRTGKGPLAERIKARLSERREPDVEALCRIRRSFARTYDELQTLSVDDLVGIHGAAVKDVPSLVQAGNECFEAADLDALRERVVSRQVAALDRAVRIAPYRSGLSDRDERPLAPEGLPQGLKTRLEQHPLGWWDLLRLSFREELKDPANERARVAWQLDVQSLLPQQLGANYKEFEQKFTELDKKVSAVWEGLKGLRADFDTAIADLTEVLDELLTVARETKDAVLSINVNMKVAIDFFQRRLKQTEAELAKAITKGEQVANLEKQVAVLESKLADKEGVLRDYKELLMNAGTGLNNLARGVPTEQLAQAKEALSKGNTDAAKRVFEQVLKTHKEAEQRAAEAAFRLGELAYGEINYTAAYQYYLEAVRLQPENALYLNMAGRITFDMGHYQEALPFFVKGLDIREKSLGPEHPNVATSINNLAALYDAQGDYAKAEPLHQRALTIREMALGPEHPDVAASLINLAALYKSRDQYAKAEPMYQRALAILEKARGPEHPAVAISLNNLAMFYQDQGDYAKAVPLHQRALAIREKALGIEHPAVAISLNNLAGFYLNQGNDAKAEPFYQRALTILEKALGPEHPDVATNLNNLAGLYHSQGDYAKAAPLYQRALAIREKALGPEHSTVATILDKYAVLLRKMERNNEASQLANRAYVIREKLEQLNAGGNVKKSR